MKRDKEHVEKQLERNQEVVKYKKQIRFKSVQRPETEGEGVRTREITEGNRSEDEHERAHECDSPMRNSSIRFFTNRTA